MSENLLEERVVALEARLTRLERLNESLKLKASRAYGFALVAIFMAVLSTFVQGGMRGVTQVALGGVAAFIFISILLLVASLVRASARSKALPQTKDDSNS